MCPGDPIPAESRAVLDELHNHVTEQVRVLARSQAEADERRARQAIIDRLPRSGPWLVHHPRALRLLFRVRPGLRPTLRVVVTTNAQT